MSSSERRRHSAAMLIWTGVIVTTAILFSRRIAGEFSLTSAWPTFFVSSISATLSLIAWGLFHHERNSTVDLRRVWLIALVGWLPTWLGGLAVAPANSPLAQGWLIGVALITGGFFALGGSWQDLRNHQAIESASSRQFILAADNTAAEKITQLRSPIRLPEATEPSFAVFDPLVDEGEEVSDGQITQRMTRQTLPDGVEEIEGSMRVMFAAGQRTVSIHIPFSPPFAVAPQVECELLSEEDVRWKVSVVYPYGIRVELKRSRSDAAADVELSYSAICEHPRSDAA